MFLDYGKNLNMVLMDVVEHPDLSDTKSILRLSQTLETFDPTSTNLGRLVSEMDLQDFANLSPDVSPKAPEILNRLRCQ